MPQNTNPWVAELLSWHGHDRGGVRVPFHETMGRPLGQVVETPLINKLRHLARDLVNGSPGTPRWIFLIGGPGNGKSEAVEALVRELDGIANVDGALIQIVGSEFAAGALAPRRVNVAPHEMPGSVLQNNVRSLIIIQDASAVDGPDHVAENTLIDDLADLVTCPPGHEPVFICCANRGLVARARSAIQSKDSLTWLNVSDVTELLTQLLTATGLGPDALAIDRPQCWPLKSDARFAAWPLDLDSIITTEGELSPFEQMMLAATNEAVWDTDTGCTDCSSRELCPFYTNSKMLRDEPDRKGLIKLLRHGEMATGQRWNFRDSFSLCAELIVGQHDDFPLDDRVHSPCLWVHERVDDIEFGGQPSTQLEAAWDLAFHLYPQALFPSWVDPLPELHKGTISQSELTRSAIEVFSRRQRSHSTQVRQLLVGAFAHKLDPALATPPESDSILREIEDEFAQSVKQGSESFGQRTLPLLCRLLTLMAEAEAHWIDTVRESSRARAIVDALRILSSTLVKRFVGVRESEYLNLEWLTEYETIFRDTDSLWKVSHPLRTVLAPDGNFGGSLIRVFGQPAVDEARDVLVTHSLGNVVPQAAPESTEARPGHDVPWMEVQGHRIPLTFDLFAALQAHSSGAQIASFAPHTRAALDNVKNTIAGISARDRQGMLGGAVSLKVGTLGQLTPAAKGTVEFHRTGTQQ